MKITATLLAFLLCVTQAHGDPIQNAIGSYKNHTDTTGTVSNKTYSPPDKSFTFAIPSLTEPGYKINDFINPKDKTQGYVTFLDDSGQFFRIDFYNNYANKTQTEVLEQLHNQTLSIFQEYFKDARLIKKEKIATDVYFALYDFPHGSTIMYRIVKPNNSNTPSADDTEVNNDKRINATRGVLYFAKENQILLLTQQFLEHDKNYRDYEYVKKNLIKLSNNLKVSSNVTQDVTDAKIQADIGYRYIQIQNFPKARYWLEKSAQQGNAHAQWLMGLLLIRGDGVEQDFSAAKKWLTQSANQNYVNAIYELGVMYNQGEGVAQSTQEAKQYFLKAAEKNHQPAIRELIKIFQAEKNTQDEQYWAQKLKP